MSRFTLRRWNYPECGRSTIEGFESAESLIERIHELFRLRPRHVDPDEDVETQAAMASAGEAYYVENETGEGMEVLCTIAGWCLAFYPLDGPALYSRWDGGQRGGRQLITNPQWEEMPDYCFLPLEMAGTALREWLELGRLAADVGWH